MELSFGGNFSVITGETGAGKSMVVQAIKTLLGSKASSDIVRHGSNECEIQGVFDVKNSEIKKTLEEIGIPQDTDDLIIRRIISSAGKNKIFINDSAVKLETLQKVASNLVEICSQFESQSALRRDNLFHLLDRHSDGLVEVKSFRIVFDELSKLKQRLSELEKNEKEGGDRLEYLKFRIKEISKIDPQPQEDTQLEDEIRKLKTLKIVQDAAMQAKDVFFDREESVLNQLGVVSDALSKIEDGRPEIIEIQEKIQRLTTLAEEVGKDIRILGKKLPSADEEALAGSIDRLNELKHLKIRLGPSLDDVLSKKNSWEIEIDALENADKYKSKILKEIQEKEAHALVLGREINKRRTKAANFISKAISDQLQDLNFKGAKIKFEVLFDENQINPYGFDLVTILFSPNKGEPEKEIAKIASGGELSRVTLAIHRVLMSKVRDKVYIFDEVDSGVGGDAGKKIGKKLKELSQGSQIVCITHLAQVAVFGDRQFVLTKEESGDRVVTGVKELTKKEDRIKEIARMLSGEKDQKAALDHAKAMLESAEKSEG